MYDIYIENEKNYDNILENNIFMNISKWGYVSENINKKLSNKLSVSNGIGGGEEFLLQTMQTMFNYGMICYWLCFSDVNNNEYKSFSTIKYEFGTIIQIPNGFSENNLINWLKIIKPNIVHHQGFLREEIYNCCKYLRIEFLSGFHFWSGAIILDGIKKNIEILKNVKFHRSDDSLTNIYDKKHCNLYTVSPFVSECIKEITGYNIFNNIYGSSSQTKCKIQENMINNILFDNCNEMKNTFVTMINVHLLKGGDIFLYLIEKLPDIPFLGIKTEKFSDILDEKIKNAIIERNKKNTCKCYLLERINDIRLVYQLTKILLIPSYVDETFCRVANEGMMNGIPIITSGRGYIKDLVKDSGIIISPNNTDEWKKTVEELYVDQQKLDILSKKTLIEYENHSEKKAELMLRKEVISTILKSKNRNVMFFTVYGDQGLGIQTRNYYNILKDIYNIFIFSYKPYICKQNNLQKNIHEWNVENIYYSENIREKVTDDEIIVFIKKYNIGKCIIPETCWNRVFEICQLVTKNDVLCYAIPNIEIVRKSEIYKHRYFHKILCNNYLCYNTFKNYGINNLEYIGYSTNAIPSLLNNNIKNSNDKIIEFLLIGGLNGISRKHLLETCEAFVLSYEKYKNIHLTCTVLEFNFLELFHVEKINKYKNHPGINIIYDHLSYKDISNLYNNTHITIQVSKHEGLGLGFYESLYYEKPLITLDTAPHNEIINKNNGWLIPCYYEIMIENNESLLMAAKFDVEILSEKINEIVENFNTYDDLIISLKKDYNDRFNVNIFKNRFVKSINT